MKSVICAIVKNEQRFIREWVEHYLKIGFSKLYIYEDYSSNSHKELLEDYILSGSVYLESLQQSKFIPLLKKGTVLQKLLYENFFNLCKKGYIEADWVGFFDVDEFLMFEDGWNLEQLEEDFKNEAGILLSWRIYGANGHINRPCGNVVDNYTTYMPNEFFLDTSCFDWNVKSLVNIKKCDGMKHIHIFNGCKMTNHSVDNGKKLCFEKAWINHYYTKSWEDYCDRMFARGNMQNNYRCFDLFFRVNNNFLPKMKDMLEEQRNHLCASTMWISHKLKLISGGNCSRLEFLRKKYVK